LIPLFAFVFVFVFGKPWLAFWLLYINSIHLNYNDDEFHVEVSVYTITRAAVAANHSAPEPPQPLTGARRGSVVAVVTALSLRQTVAS
jgi:hypothetical protein